VEDNQLLRAEGLSEGQALVNPAPVRAMVGHKTDKIDRARIAEFDQHGCLAASFIPPVPIRQARALER
jgi:hypothetical protein